MRALVTGACGFVGAFLVRELVDAGNEVIATDLSAAPADARQTRGGGAAGVSSCASFPPGVAYRGCDLHDAAAVKDLIANTRPDCVYHLAAQSSAARSLENPRGTMETNVFGALNVLEGVRELSHSCPGAKTRSGKVRVLSVGSGEEYGRRPQSEMPLGEESRIAPVSPYAVSKAAQTMLAVQYARSYGLDVVATRSFSHTGPGQTDRFVLPSFARQCAEIKVGKRAPTVKTGSLRIARDFLDVRDVVRAYRMIVEDVDEGDVYNVCSGRALVLGEALDFLVRACGVAVNVEEDAALVRSADIPVLVGDNARLRGACRWEQEHSIETMLSDLFEYWERIAREI
jgi:GDP-4-dehydro-6-deoxy-D-mannose reductase